MTILLGIICGLGALFICVIGFLAIKLNKLISSKVEALKEGRYEDLIQELVFSSVKTIYQTYVENCKKTSSFNSKEQREALEKCLSLIKEQCSEKVSNYILTTYGDLNTYLRNLIESTIYSLKN